MTDKWNCKSGRHKNNISSSFVPRNGALRTMRITITLISPTLKSLTNSTQGLYLENMRLSWVHWIVFVIMLALSASVGLYFAFFSKTKQNTFREYILGGNKLGSFPVAMSVLASHISPTTMIGIPADVYSYGIAIWYVNLGALAASIFVANAMLPIFFHLRLTNTTEYIELRFGTKTRKIAAALFIFGAFLALPLVVYVPVLALDAVADFEIKGLVLLAYVICICYTTIGGVKAVLWTDFLQAIYMLTAVISVLIIGLKITGGFQNVWKTSIAGQRLTFNLRFDFTEKALPLTAFVGSLFFFTFHFGVNQNAVQKYLSIGKLSEAKRAVYLSAIGISILKTLLTLVGLVIYTKYEGCDPLKHGTLKRSDHIFPYFIVDVARNIFGLPGLFVAGVFSASLSTISSLLNTLSGMLYKEFLVEFLPKAWLEKQTSSMLKLIAVVCSIICGSLVYFIKNIHGLVPLTFSIMNAIFGPHLGLYALGILIPFANEKGAIVGTICSLIAICGISFSTQILLYQGIKTYKSLPTSIHKCLNGNTTMTLNATADILDVTTKVPYINKLSYFSYSPFSSLLVVFVGIIVSLLTGGHRSSTKMDLISPLTKICMRRKTRKDFLSVETALQEVELNQQ